MAINVKYTALKLVDENTGEGLGMQVNGKAPTQIHEVLDSTPAPQKCKLKC